MGRGSSAGNGGQGKVVRAIVTTSGTIDLSDSPLKYGKKDTAVSEELRQQIGEKWNATGKEHFQSYAADGTPIGRVVRGTSGSVKPSAENMMQEAMDVHNHPRADGAGAVLGGTFSTSDLQTFVYFGNVRTKRVEAGEGTYSITKVANFDGRGLLWYTQHTSQKRYSDYTAEIKKLNKRIGSDSNYSYERYVSDHHKATNKYLVSLHEDLIAGQKSFGYTYTLERA